MGGCASSGAPAARIAQPQIAAAYLPLQDRILGLPNANGAAMVIAPGVAVTNDHNDNLVSPKTILGFGSASDLMFFRTTRNLTPPVAEPAIGKAVTAYGQGGSAELRVAHGVICSIAGVAGHADSPYFIFAGNAGPGFSGGPVLDGDGRLIGITFGFEDRPQNRRLIFAYDMKRVAAEFQRKQPRKFKPGEQGGPDYGGCDRKS